METARDITEQLIRRVKNLQKYTVERYMDMPPFVGGRIPFDISHTAGGPFIFTVYASSSDEAKKMVDDWLDNLEDPEC